MSASRCASRRESPSARTHARCLCAGVSWARPPVSLGLLCGGGSASAVFSAARFRFPFESLSYIFEYGIGALYAAPRVAGLAEYSAVYHPSTARPGDPTPAVAVPPLDARAAWRGGARSPSPRAPSDRCGARVPSLLSRPAWRCPRSNAARATPPMRRSLAALPEPPRSRFLSAVRRTCRSLLASIHISSMSADPRFIPRAAADERIKVRLHVWQGESLGAHTHDRCLCAGVSWARPPVWQLHASERSAPSYVYVAASAYTCGGAGHNLKKSFDSLIPGEQS